MFSVNYFENRTTNSAISGPEIWNTEHLVITSVVLGIIIICIIIGNSFVITAIIIERNLHCVANYLILSLAMADFLVATLVMPISAVNEVTRRWFLGREVCDMWITMDVLCCTASILSLVAISFDRYWAVTSVEYTRNRSAKRILGMVASVWILSFSISIPSVIIFQDENDPTISGICIISQNHVYTIVSTVGAFYLPMMVILIIYAKIFAVARQRILRKRFSKRDNMLRDKKMGIRRKRPFSYPSEISPYRLSRDAFPECELALVKDCEVVRRNTLDKHLNFFKRLSYADSKTTSKANFEMIKAQQENAKIKKQKERKVAITLSIITGTFLLCWLPFFIIAITAPFVRPSMKIPRLVESITLWLGYCNSLLNPIIYTVFNPEFRTAFKHIILNRCLTRCRKERDIKSDTLWIK